jgi:hypothetical protein
MNIDSDKTYLLSEILQQNVSKDNFTTVFSLSGRGWVDCVLFKINDTDMDLKIEVDGVAIVDTFRLKQFSSVYGLSNNSDFDLPLTSIDSKTFRLRLKDCIQYDQSFIMKLKHADKANKVIQGGYVTYQQRPII